jgi:nucleotide-binding universal stress UspA family protein
MSSPEETPGPADPGAAAPTPGKPTPRTPAEHGGGSCMVLGYDRTESARRAARWAAGELTPDGRLVIVHASRPLHAPPSPLLTPHEREHFGRAIIDELLLEGDDALFDVEVHTEILDTDPVSALIDAARRHGADTIVVGSEEHSRLRTALGTVTSELLKHSPVPVVAVPHGEPTADAPEAAETA